ncbi:hypothetical protein FHU31_005651 [Mycolicibacterium fluoranthenivorans]|uniref:Uncharacterized protein n=1 Tax=Mycolicibacterium fluoranthenivorans TaxID=258505 RepID=A0A7X5U570_9MYCO|nr:hypothetical protein [Mycolicibacterium fluoranthenivorans]NIH98632.1 hypothetical protein [Mycolicibacterium fluoranthenivorans]
MPTPPWTPAGSAAELVTASTRAEILACACMFRMPSAISSCHCRISVVVTAWAPGVVRPISDISMLSGQLCPCRR